MAKKLVVEIFRDDDTDDAFMQFHPHGIDPGWVAEVMYMVLNRYMHAMPDSMQNEFFGETMQTFTYLLKDQLGAALLDINQVKEE